ncbi:hypothetical protein [Microbacterium oxydans]|uniref:hypothetical protein n=1 Tax=Microbacterium oxydans TaxID=82380 RepID=UPI0022B1B3BC|nr:hypothetical protein [Microbacterium oxydans]MCZ4302464.1 hypothetical protein [Microbacterium oxydans]
MSNHLSKALIAVPFALFLLLFPLISGLPITWWNIVGAILFVVVFYISQAVYDKRRDRNSRPDPHP